MVMEFGDAVILSFGFSMIIFICLWFIRFIGNEDPYDIPGLKTIDTRNKSNEKSDDAIKIVFSIIFLIMGGAVITQTGNTLTLIFSTIMIGVAIKFDICIFFKYRKKMLRFEERLEELEKEYENKK